MPKQFRNEKWRQFIAMGYSCLVHQTLSYSLLCSIVEIFWRGSFVPLACRARRHLPHSAPSYLRHCCNCNFRLCLHVGLPVFVSLSVCLSVCVSVRVRTCVATSCIQSQIYCSRCTVNGTMRGRLEWRCTGRLI